MRVLSRRVIVALALAATLETPAPAQSPGDPPGGSSEPLSRAEIASSVAGAMDPSADPCTDFYRYACGGWLDAVELPADQPIWTRSFSVIHARNRELLRTLVEGAAKGAAAEPADDSDRRLVGRVYSACMDEARVEEAGIEGLDAVLARIDAAPDNRSLFALAGELHRLGAAPFLDIDIDSDFREPRLVVAHLAQGGLGLPERDYYLSDDEEKVVIREAYRNHVARTLTLLGSPPEEAARRADGVLDFETSLAKASRPVEDMRVYDELHHRLDAEGLGALAAGLPWDAFFTALGRPGLRAVNVMTPEFFPALEEALLGAAPATLRAYLRQQLLTGTAPLLSDRYYLGHFDFYGRTLHGQQEPQPRWKRCIAATEEAVGQALGRLYVAERFAGDSKAIALEMIGRISDAFASKLPELGWMDETTRNAALGKRDTLSFRIGYPDRWRDYSRLTIGPNHLVNLLAARELETDRQLAKVGEPVDPTDWGWNPQVVNASYHPGRNDHTYPAGILQPPFFHRAFPAAMNFGGIGYVVGHELTHGFDDQGRKFDASGRLADWWTEESVAGFEERSTCVRDEYSEFEIEPGVHLNGELTLGENIADIGGLKQAWNAYRSWEAEQPGRVEGLAGLSSEQLFFVAAAQVWCAEVAPELNRVLVQSDPHSPARFRVLGTMRHQEAFAEAFSCETGEPMSPQVRCEVW